MREPRVLLWYMRYNNPEVDDFETIEHAMSFGRYGEDDGQLAAEYIELLETGEVLSWEDACERFAESPRFQTNQKPITTEVLIRAPTCEMVRYGVFHSVAEAEEFIAPLKELLGERIVVADRWPAR